jgi:hypothetical protein
MSTIECKGAGRPPVNQLMVAAQAFVGRIVLSSGDSREA